MSEYLSLKDLGRDARKITRSFLWKAKTAVKKVEVTKGQLVDSLVSLGIANGDVVFVHSSLSALGYVMGGPETIVKAIIEVVGDNGTVLMPTYPFKGTMVEHLSRRPVFDVKNDPSYTGAVTEYFRRISSYRSYHAKRSEILLHIAGGILCAPLQLRHRLSQGYSRLCPTEEG